MPQTCCVACGAPKDHYVYVIRLPDGTPVYQGTGWRFRIAAATNADLKSLTTAGNVLTSEKEKTGRTQAEASANEIRLISRHKRVCDGGTLLNRATGGKASRGWRCTEEQRKAYRGRPEGVERNAGIASMLRDGLSWSAIERATGCSRATVAKIAKRSRVAQPRSQNHVSPESRVA